MSVTVRHLRGPSVFSEAGSGFDDLAQRQRLPVTARRRWLQAWIESHPQWEPWLVLLEDGDATLAAAPLAQRRRGPLLEVVMLGHGPSDDVRLTAETPELVDRLAREIDAALRATRLWRLRLRQLPVDSLVAEALLTLLPASKKLPGQHMPQIEVTDPEPGHYLSRNARKGLTRSRNKISKRGLESQVEVTTDPDGVAALLPELMRVHRERDLAVGRRPDHDDPSAKAFYQKVITSHAAAGEVEVLSLRLGGDLAAYECGFRDGRALRIWDGRLAPRWADVSAGRLISVENLRHVVTSPDYDLLDLMRGEEDDKLRMATRTVPMANYYAWSSPVLQRLDETSQAGATGAREAIRRAPALEQGAKRLWHRILAVKQRPHHS